MKDAPHRSGLFGHHIYRKVRRFSLALMIGLAGGVFFLAATAEGRIQAVTSRFTLVEKASLAFGAGSVDEEGVIRSQLLDPCPDNRVHLDWPASRGVAAQVLWRLLRQQKGFIPTAGYFLDIGPTSPLAEPLANVGGAFAPIDTDRFKPDRLIREQELDEILAALQKRIPEGIASLPPMVPSLGTPASAANAISEKRFEPGFTFPGTQTSVGELLTPAIETASGTASDTLEADIARLERLSRIVPPDQLSSADGFDLRECEDGVAETDKCLDSLEINILDLSAMSDLEPKEDKQVRDALSQLDNVLSGVQQKLRLSERTLAVALLVDSDSIRRAAVLKQQLHQQLDRITHLADRIRERLQRPLEEKTE